MRVIFRNYYVIVLKILYNIILRFYMFNFYFLKLVYMINNFLEIIKGFKKYILYRY